MFYIRLLNNAFLILFLFGTQAFARPTWGEETMLSSETPVKAVWGSEQKKQEASPEQEQTVFEVAGLFFDSDPEPGQSDIPLPPWLRYAVSVPDIPEETPMIAIVIDDLGINRKMTRRVLALPAPLTASFLAYADDLSAQTEAARQAGHELLVHTPMEPVNKNHHAGPGALTSQMSDEEIKDRLDLMLSSFSGYVGINNHMGSKFTANARAMNIVMDEVNKRGLLFLDSLTSKDSTAKKTAQKKNIPYAVRNVFLDNSHDETEILKQLALLEKQARNHKVAVGIGHPHKETVDALKKWIPQAKKRGFAFIPISMAAVFLQDEEHTEDVQALNLHDEWE